MKKILLSLVAMVLITVASAQSFTDHFASTSVVDTTIYKNFIGGPAIAQAGGPFTLSIRPSCSTLDIQTGGQGEWDGVRLIFATPINLFANNHIYVRWRKKPGSVSDTLLFAIGVGDVNKNAVNNQYETGNSLRVIRDTNWHTFSYSVSSWWNQYGNGNKVDSSKISYLNLGFNNGFYTGAIAGWAQVKTAFNGSVEIDYIQIGGTAPANGTTCFAPISGTGINDLSSSTASFKNFPNPAKESTKIQYSVVDNGLVSIKVYDIIGNEVTTLVNENKTTGTYEVNYNTSALQSGIYFYTMTVGSKFIGTKKMMVIK